MQLDISKKLFHLTGTVTEQAKASPTQSTVQQKTMGHNTRLLPLIDIFNRKGFQCGYSITDAAASLWQRENTRVRRDDAPSVARLQARLRSGNLRMTPTQEEIKDYLACLRRDGLSGQIDWHGFAAELRSFQDMPPEELTASLDYVASRYVSVRDKLTRNFTGSELAEQESELKSVWATGVTNLVDGYVNFLQINLGASDLDAQAVRVSLDALIEQKISTYHTMVGQTNADAA